MRVTMTLKREVLGFFECREWGLFLWWGAAGFFLLKTRVLSRESTEWEDICLDPSPCLLMLLNSNIFGQLILVFGPT